MYFSSKWQTYGNKLLVRCLITMTTDNVLSQLAEAGKALAIKHGHSKNRKAFNYIRSKLNSMKIDQRNFTIRCRSLSQAAELISRQ